MLYHPILGDTRVTSCNNAGGEVQLLEQCPDKVRGDWIQSSRGVASLEQELRGTVLP